MNWYSTISRDITKIHDGISYFENELQQAKIECRITGNIEKSSAAMPGIVEQRFNQLQEIEAILEFLNIELRSIKSQHFRRYLENYNRSLSSRDCDRFVEGEADVADFEKMINEFALLRNKWLGITKSLEVKQWQLSNIIKLRVAGMEDSTI
jgi:conjugal transfer/entry exclusion protein